MNFNNSLPFIWLLTFFLGCDNSQTSQAPSPNSKTFLTPLGKEVIISAPSGKMLELYKKAKADFDRDPADVDNIIWYGRRTAYLPAYLEAIDIYTKGIEQYPNDPRLHRHRGHRYISIREFNKAIDDLEKATELIKGTQNEVEPDGLPNAMGIPVSTLHGNIWYHLGLAYYLKHDFENAYVAYTNCRNAHTNDDNIVSSTHWLYMIQRRLGNDSLASELLQPILDTMNIIENFSYHNLCKFYKGLTTADSLLVGEGSAQDAVLYGLANWEFYNGNPNKAKEKLETILNRDSWNSFGYIAAEADYMKIIKNEPGN